MPDELDSIFPDLQGLLTADWDTQASGLATDPEHGGVTAESLDQFLREQLSRGIPGIGGVPTSGGGSTTSAAPAYAETPPPSPEAEPDEPEPDEEEAPETAPPLEPEEAEPAPVQPDAPDVVTINGRAWTRDQLEAFARFSDSLDQDPSLQSLLTSYYTGRLETLQQPPQQAAPAFPVQPAPAAYLPPPAPPAPALDEYEDPRIVALQQQIAQQNTYIAQLAQAQQLQAQQQVAQSQQAASTLMNRASASFAEQHGLTDDEVLRLRKSASRMGHIDAFMSGIDPITNAPTRPDLLSATERALEIAYWADPALRQREIDRAMERQRERNRKRQRLAGVGGSSGSVSRTPTAPAPGTQDARAAMVAEVGQMLSGTWTEPGR